VTVAPAPRPGRGRRIAVWTLIVVTGLLVLVSSLTVWVKRQVLDTDNWTEASSKLLANDEIRHALAVSISDTILTNVDIEAQLSQRFPDRQQLVPLLATTIERAVLPATEELLEAPRLQVLWQEANRLAHAKLVALLEGNEGGRITTEGGNVVLDLRPLVDRVAQRFDIQVQNPDAGQILIMRSDQLEAAQKAVRAVKVMTVFLGLVVLVLFAVAIYLAKGFRRQALRGAGATLVFVGILLLVVRRVVGQAIVEALTSAQTEPAAGAAWLIATDLLKDVAVAVLAAGVIVVIGAWLAGPTRVAVGFRRAVAPTCRDHPALVYGGVFLVFLLVLLWGPTRSDRGIIGLVVLVLLPAADRA
jgi:hypothetical protein